MKKRNITLALCITYSILIIFFDFFKFDIILKASYSFGAEIVIGFCLYFPYIIFAILLIYSITFIFTRFKTKKWKSIIPAAVMIITTYLLVFFPYTNAYVNMFYALNKIHFQKTIQMVNDGEICQYIIGDGEYLVPYRLTSYSGIMCKDVQNGETKVKFYAFRGSINGNDVIIVYSSDDSSIDSDDFSDGIVKWNLSNIKKLCPNWYSATTNCYEMTWKY